MTKRIRRPSTTMPRAGRPPACPSARISACLILLLLGSLGSSGCASSRQLRTSLKPAGSPCSPVVDLIFCIDSSGTIFWNGLFDPEVRALAEAVEDRSIIPRDGSVRVAVLKFGSNVSVEVPPTLVDASSYTTISAAIRSMQPFQPGFYFTNIRGCIAHAQNILMDLPGDTEWQVLDISTDGEPTIDEDCKATSCSLENLQGRVIQAANQIEAAGLDALNLLGFGPDAGSHLAFMETVVRPTPAGGREGFVTLVADARDYPAALAMKIRRELCREQPEVDLAVRKWCRKAEGRFMRCDISVLNLGKREAGAGVEISEPFSTGIRWSIESSVVPASWSCETDGGEPETVTCRFTEPIASGSVSATVALVGEGPVHEVERNCVELVSSSEDEFPENDSFCTQVENVIGPSSN